MSDVDEYDEYFFSIDLTDILAAEAASGLIALPLSGSTNATPYETPQSSQPSTPLGIASVLGDEFDSYDLSEFTAEELANVDALVLMNWWLVSSTPAGVGWIRLRTNVPVSDRKTGIDSTNT